MALQYGGWAAVECEGNPEESLYFLGRLMKVDSRYLTMKRVTRWATGFLIRWCCRWTM